MKFQSMYGLGQMVRYDTFAGYRIHESHWLRVVEVSFDEDGAKYLCEFPANGYTRQIPESCLSGDPDFDQDSGGYKKKEKTIIQTEVKSDDLI